MRNVEIKAVAKNLERILELSKKLSNSSGTTIKQHDTFYNVNKGRLKLRRFEEGNGQLIFYERPDNAGPKLSTFDCVPLEQNAITSMHSLLCNALGEKGDVKKTRQLFLVGQTRIHVDCVENLGNFLELEVVLRDDQSVEEGQKIAEELIKKLEVDEGDFLIGAYHDLLQKN